MEENRREDGLSADTKVKGTFLKKVENFWYYYKWHTIVAVFLIAAVLICSLQMCAKETVDFHIMYAGGESVSRGSSDGDIPVYHQIASAVGEYADDVDGDGKKNVALTTYYTPSPDEIKRLEADGVDVPYSLIEQDSESLKTRFTMGEYYLCFLSPYVYEQYKGSGDNIVFKQIAQYAPAESSIEYYSPYAVKLSSLGIYKNNPALRDNLPEDTLVVIRRLSAAALDKKQTEENFKLAEEVLHRMLAE